MCHTYLWTWTRIIRDTVLIECTNQIIQYICVITNCQAQFICPTKQQQYGKGIDIEIDNHALYLNSAPFCLHEMRAVFPRNLHVQIKNLALFNFSALLFNFSALLLNFALSASPLLFHLAFLALLFSLALFIPMAMPRFLLKLHCRRKKVSCMSHLNLSKSVVRPYIARQVFLL